jgi:hypothetical protein
VQQHSLLDKKNKNNVPMVHQTSEHVDVGTTNCGKIVKDGVEISLQKNKQKNNNNHSDQKKKKKEESEKV